MTDADLATMTVDAIVPRLLDEVERLRSENAALKERVRVAEEFMGWEMRDIEDAESVREERPGE